MTDHLEQAAERAVELAAGLTGPHEQRCCVEAAAHLTYMAGLLRGGAARSIQEISHAIPLTDGELPVIDYERTLVSKDRNRTFFNKRTGEVVPAGTDDVAGRVTRNRDGSYTAHRADGGRQRVATEEAAVYDLIKNYRS